MATLEELENIVARIGARMEEVAEAHRDTERALARFAEESKKSDADLKKTVNYWVGRFGNTTGYITEMLIVPGIRQQMSKHGHEFDSLSARKEFYRKDGTAFTEADLILENGKEVMVVEVKTRLTTDEIDYQVKRLKRLRKGEKEAKIEGKSLISAVAGLSIDEDASKAAKELGMYVIRLIEDVKKIQVEAPDKGVGRW